MMKFYSIALITTLAGALTIEAEAEIQALIELEGDDEEETTDSTLKSREEENIDVSMPCPFPDVDQFNTPEYLAQTASCKKRQIWNKVTADRSINRWFDGPDLMPLFTQDMNLSFDHTGDTMPEGRVKMTHPRGVTSKVAFIPTADSPYTGMFRGAKHGIMRISETVRTSPEVNQTSPGFGIKFLRDGMDSADTVTMFSFDGQASHNYFANRWSTHLNEPVNECSRETIGKKLAETTPHIGAMSVMNWGKHDEEGNEEEEPKWPFILEFEPFDVYGWTDDWQADFTD